MSAREWRPSPPASAVALQALRARAPDRLPASYFEQLAESNGGEGTLSVDPGWVAFWPAETVLESNEGYAVHEFLPGFFGFGSSGAGVLFAFDLRGDEPVPVVAVPFTPMDEDEAVTIAPSFDDFRRAIGGAPPSLAD